MSQHNFTIPKLKYLLDKLVNTFFFQLAFFSIAKHLF